MLAGIIDDPKERDLLTTAEDYIEPLLTITNSTPATAPAPEEDSSQLLASTSTSPLLPTHHNTASPAAGPQQQRTSTRTAIVSVESDHSLFTRSWQRRNAFTIYCVALFNCLAVTMSSHPGISSFICSVNNPALVRTVMRCGCAGRHQRRLAVLVYQRQPSHLWFPCVT